MKKEMLEDLKISFVYFFTSRFNRWMHRHGYHKMERNWWIEPGRVHHWCHWCGLRGETFDQNHYTYLSNSLGLQLPKDFDVEAFNAMRKEAGY